jgi:putative ABC transport system permease protein
MFRNYFKVAVRTLTKNKMFSFINIFGLALSMSVCLIVLLRVKDQVGYDRFHPNPSRTYRIITDLSNKEGNQFHFATSPLPLVKELNSKYDIVESATQLYLPGRQDAATLSKKLPVNKIFTDPSFFKIFGFTLSSGDAATALALPNSVVLSRETALRFFGTTNVSGQTITFKDWGDFRVTGVLDLPKGKSHIDYEALLSMSSVPALEKEGKLNAFLDSWNNFTTSYTYLTIRNGITEIQLQKAIAATSADILKHSKMAGKESFSFREQPLNDIILGEELNFSIGDVGSKGKVWAEAGIAFIILLSACFNYTNLSIARSFNRGKEVGVRKVSGAFRSHVFIQFILESVLVCLLALGLAYVFLQLIIDHAPFASEMIPGQFHFDPTLFLWFFGFSLFTGLLAGILPAWALSAFKPVQVLKNLTTVKLFGGNGFRKTLIVVQFTLSLVLIMFTQIFTRQFSYMANADAGFNQHNLVSISLQGADPNLLKAEMSRLSGVERISVASADFGKNSATETQIKSEPTAEPIVAKQYDIDEEVIPNMQLRLIAGQNFPVALAGQAESKVIVNEQVLQLLKIRSAAAAIGKTVWLDDSIQVSIAGVMKDFYFQGVGVPLRPLVFRNRSSNFNVLTIRTKTGDKSIMSSIGAIWKKYEPAIAINYNWLQDGEASQAIGSVSMLDFLALITAVLACMGLLGMVTYNIQIRRKEIGIRKVMGAGVPVIISLLSRSFLKLVLIAGCIALPIGYILGYLFLNLFANRTSIGVFIPLGSLLGLLAIALLTMGSQVYRVAVANPVKSLRTE